MLLLEIQPTDPKWLMAAKLNVCLKPSNMAEEIRDDVEGTHDIKYANTGLQLYAIWIISTLLQPDVILPV